MRENASVLMGLDIMRGAFSRKIDTYTESVNANLFTLDQIQIVVGIIKH